MSNATTLESGTSVASVNQGTTPATPVVHTETFCGIDLNITEDGRIADAKSAKEAARLAILLNLLNLMKVPQEGAKQFGQVIDISNVGNLLRLHAERIAKMHAGG
jgi:hypothetical protein